MNFLFPPNCQLNSERFILLLLLFLVSLSSQGQEETKPRAVPVEIRKKDATQLSGMLMGIEKDSILFRDHANRDYRIALKEIRNIDYVDSLKRRTRWHESPNTIRYLLSPTAFALDKNELVLESAYIFFNSIRYGISDRISVAAGAEVLSRSLYFANVKASLIKKPSYNLAASLNYYYLPPDFLETYYGDDIRNLGMLSAMNTWGNSDHHLSLSAGYLYAQGQFLPPTITVSGTTRLTKHLALVSENWFLFVTDRQRLPIIYSLGLRVIGKQGVFDIGLYRDSVSSESIGLPFVGYTYKMDF